MDINYYKKYEPIDGKWYINKEIGRGAFGAVYEVERHDFSDMKAAMKIITIPANKSVYDSFRQENFSMTDEMVKEYYYSIVCEYIKEFQLMSKLKGNSNIVSYEDHDVRERTDYIGWDIFIRMELLRPMSDYFQNNYTRERVIKLGIDICKALEVCQRYNIIHRDIKPTNIFVSSTGEFKLGDFGVAKILEKSNSHMSTKGTYTYMAPEVCRGERYSGLADIYSLGIVMYKLLNNNLEPFRKSTEYGEAQKALEMRLQGYEMIKPANADDNLSEIILKACKFNPGERYQTPAQMRRQLEALQAGTYSSSSYVHGGSTYAASSGLKGDRSGFGLPSDFGSAIKVSKTGAMEKAFADKMVKKTVKSVKSSKTASKAKRKKSKKGLVAICVILFLIIVAACTAFGLYAHYSNLYKKAESRLSSENYSAARSIYEEIKWFKDSEEKILLCDYEEAANLLKMGDYDAALSIYETLKAQNFKDSEQCYNEAVFFKVEDLLKKEKVSEALSTMGIFAGDDDEEIVERLNKYKLQAGNILADDGNYEKAIEIYSEIHEEAKVLECKYLIALEYKEAGEYVFAMGAFSEIFGYRDSNNQFDLTEELLIEKNKNDYMFLIPNNLKGKYSNTDGYYVDYSLDKEVEYNLPHSLDDDFKVNYGVHFHGNNKDGWEKQWVYEAASADVLNVYNYIDQQVYVLTLE